MNVDVSPDGNPLVFDLLGDIYTLPMSGGVAAPLLSGRAWEGRPRYSPDGRKIAFVSDRSTPVGGNVDNVWVLDLATKELHQLTNSEDLGKAHGSRVGLVDAIPAWVPNGQEVVFGTHDR